MVANSLSFSYVIHRCYKEPVTVSYSYIALVADNSRLAADNLPQEANNLRLAADNSRLEADNLPQKAINLRLADDSYLADAIAWLHETLKKRMNNYTKLS